MNIKTASFLVFLGVGGLLSFLYGFYRERRLRSRRSPSDK